MIFKKSENLLTAGNLSSFVVKVEIKDHSKIRWQYKELVLLSLPQIFCKVKDNTKIDTIINVGYPDS
jgi:hypothetical protein